MTKAAPHFLSDINIDLAVDTCFLFPFLFFLFWFFFYSLRVHHRVPSEEIQVSDQYSGLVSLRFCVLSVSGRLPFLSTPGA